MNTLVWIINTVIITTIKFIITLIRGNYPLADGEATYPAYSIQFLLSHSPPAIPSSSHYSYLSHSHSRPSLAHFHPFNSSSPSNGASTRPHFSSHCSADRLNG